MAVARRKASVLSHDEDSEQLYNLFNGVTVNVGGDAGLSVLPFFHTLFELDEMSATEFYQTLKDGDLSDIMAV